MKHENPEESLTFTLTRLQWKIIMHLALRGGKEALELFVNGTAHTTDCITANVNAVKALHEQIYPDQPLTGVPSGPEEGAVH
jgi:hypothetical protein